MKKVMLINTLMLLSTLALAQTAVIGSGGDGLIQRESTPRKAAFDVEVPYPGNNDSKQTIIVKGNPTGEQAKLEYCVTSFKKNMDNVPIIVSGHNNACSPLNKKLKVNHGPVLISFSGSLFITEKKPNEPLVINLRKIKVPYHNGKIEFNVFSDLTNNQEQIKLVTLSWINKKNTNVFNGICNSSLNLAAQMCQILIKNNFKDYGRTAVLFHSNATHSIITINSNDTKSYSKPKRNWITDPKDGDYVSVLPGVYGIEWRDRETEQISTTYGIEVK